MQSKKRFGIWTHDEYLAKVDDNAKLYQKIGEIARYRLKCKLRANIRFIISQLRDNDDEFRQILGTNSDEKWRTNYYRSPFSHLKKCLTGARGKMIDFTPDFIDPKSKRKSLTRKS